MHPLLVSAAVVVHEGRILIARRKRDVPYPLLWEFPGGKVEPDEDPKDAILRELKEELDMDAEVDGIYDVVYHRYPERTVLVLSYRCRWLGGELRDLDVTEHCWVLPDELPGYEILPADAPLVARLMQESL